jgi:hypothetical protein
VNALDLDMLHALVPVGLDELTDSADLLTRRDRKYLIDASIVGRILDCLAGSAAALEIDGLRTFRYESVYFDTPTLASYHATAHAAGVASKCAPGATSTVAPARSR